jgi:hypothetical protein
LRIALAVAVIALVVAATGVAYSLWSEQLTVKTSVATGELDIRINSAVMLDGCSGTTPDYNIQVDQEGKPDFTRYFQISDDVACGNAQLIDSDNDGDTDTVIVTLNNVYPRYYNQLSFSMENIGTIPLKLWYIEVDDSNGQPIARFYLNNIDELTGKNGYMIDLNGDSKPDVAISLRDGLGELLDTGGAVTSYTIQFAILDDAPEGSQLAFYVKPVAVQWNGYTESAPSGG